VGAVASVRAAAARAVGTRGWPLVSRVCPSAGDGIRPRGRTRARVVRAGPSNQGSLAEPSSTWSGASPMATDGTAGKQAGATNCVGSRRARREALVRQHTGGTGATYAGTGLSLHRPRHSCGAGPGAGVSLHPTLRSASGFSHPVWMEQPNSALTSPTLSTQRGTGVGGGTRRVGLTAVQRNGSAHLSQATPQPCDRRTTPNHQAHDLQRKGSAQFADAAQRPQRWSGAPNLRTRWRQVPAGQDRSGRP
jgi:hypothetical protein